ncbi:MAG: CHASE3 domain-containing protein [Flavobacteriales bacterium]|nr:CHASE3 domain-containing protein [Flavobacteriales bacterium]
MPNPAASEERHERRTIIVLYAGTLVLLGILLYATYTNMEQNDAAARSIRTYNQGMLELSQLLNDLQDQENGVRGYLLTKDTSFLNPRALLIPPISVRLRVADSLLTDPAWRIQLQVLRVKCNDAQVQLAAMIADSASGLPSTESASAGLRSSRISMAEVRDVHARIMDQLRKNRDVQFTAEKNTPVSTPIMLVLYSALALAATALLFWRLSRALRNTEWTKLRLQVNLAKLDAEVLHRASVQGMLQKVLDTSPNGIMVFRSVKDEKGTVVDFEFLSANRQANIIAERDDLVGKRLLAELPEHFTAGLFDAFVRVVESGVPFRKDLHYQGAGMDLWFSTHAVRFEDGFLVTFADITNHKHAQEMQAEADRIALTGQITRTVAHEVRNPLTNIHLAVEQLHEEVVDRDGQVLAFFLIIDRNLKRIGTLINEMLESTQQRELRLAPCPVRVIVAETMKQVADRLALKDIACEVSVAADLPDLLVDCELIKLALTNIAVNAVEAMEPAKGRLRITATRIADDVLLEIADNGKGIEPENLVRLFEPFYSGRSGGLGLGLTTARSILNDHKVKLEVRSNVREGTSFFLRFPQEVFAEASL